MGRQSRGSEEPWPKSSSCVRTSNGAAWDSSRNRLCASAKAYAQWDAEQRFEVPGIRVTDPKAAQCGEVLKGVLKPAQCKLFGNECTPEHPVGALMVSSEGSCAAYFNYEHRKAAAHHRLRTLRCVESCTNMATVLPKIRFRDPQIEMAHGAGGKASRRLVEGLFAPLLCGTSTEPLGDAAHLTVERSAHRHHHR